MAWWLMPRTPDPEVGGFKHKYSPKVRVIPRKQWLLPNMTEKLFTRTLKINQPDPTVPLIKVFYFLQFILSFYERFLGEKILCFKF